MGFSKKPLLLSIPDFRDRRQTLKSLRQSLTALSSQGQRLETCADPELVCLLRRIYHGRTERFREIVNWFENNSSPPNKAAESSTAASGQRRLPVSIKEQVTPDLLIFKLPCPADFRFLPGQHVKLRLGDTQRNYSIVSAPHEPFLEFFVELMPEGIMSQRLRGLTVGDTVELGRQGKGKFSLEQRFPDHLMVATVTGVNPFVSMMRANPSQGNSRQRFFLLHGASFHDEFGYRTELENRAAVDPRWVYIPTISRPDDPRNAAWKGERGRVHTLIDKYRDKFGLNKETTVVYACGNPAMVDAVEARYRDQGFTVKVERYD